MNRDAGPLLLSAMPLSVKIGDLKWWQGHSPLAVITILLIILASSAPFFVGYLIEPPGLRFTGALIYPEDTAAHEAWASQMAAHLTYQNLFTPEPTARVWFLSPLDLGFGLIQRATGIPYMVLKTGLGVACAPALAFSLMHLLAGLALAVLGLPPSLRCSPEV